jgi:hypothetical protein
MPKGRARPFLKVYDDFLGSVKLNRAAEIVHAARPEWSHKMARAVVFHVWTELATTALRHHTDGLIQAHVLSDIENADLVVPALVRAGLCNQRNGEIWIHNWLRYYPAASTIKERARQNRERQQRHRNRAKNGELPHNQKTH